MIVTAAAVQVAKQDFQRLQAECERVDASAVDPADVDRASLALQQIQTAVRELRAVHLFHELRVLWMRLRLSLNHVSLASGIPEWLAIVCASALIFATAMFLSLFGGLGGVSLVIAATLSLVFVLPAIPLLRIRQPTARNFIERHMAEASSRKRELETLSNELQVASAKYQDVARRLECRRAFETSKATLDHLISLFDEEKARLAATNWRDLRGIAFEQFLVEVFQMLGYAVQTTKASGDQGVDLLAVKGSIKLAIQAKGYGGSVGNSAVQEAFAGKAHYGCSQCVVVTNSYFTSGAFALASSTGCLLIDGTGIPKLIAGQLL
jgi:restriction system protein